MSKILAIDVDGKKDKSLSFFDRLESELQQEVIPVTLRPIAKNVDTTHIYDKFVEASFSLEEYVFNNVSYFTPQKPFINAIFVFGNYSTDNIEFLKPYTSIFDKDLLIFQSGYNSVESNWVFGNIIAMIKWSASLYKLDANWFPDIGRDALTNTTFLNMAIWYATRIGLSVKAF